jgi:hypothetical protein
MSKEKVLNLSVAERLKATYLLNEFKGSLDKLSIILEDIKQFSFSPEELVKISGKIVNNGDGSQTVNWDVSKEKDVAKDIKVQDATLEYLRTTIKAKSEKGEFGLGDVAVIGLKEKLG